MAITNPDTIAKLDPSVIGSLQSNTEAISTLPVEAQNTVLGAFMDSFQVVFWVAVPVVVIGFFFSLFLREKPLQDSQAHASALIVTSLVLHIPKVKREHKIDYLGALLIVASVVSILIALSVLGPENGWSDPRTVASLSLGFLIVIIYMLWEKRVTEPILPLSLFRNHTFSLTSIIGFIIGAGMFGAIIMLPLYLQIVQGATATEAGLKLIPLMIGILTVTITSGE